MVTMLIVLMMFKLLLTLMLLTTRKLNYQQTDDGPKIINSGGEDDVSPLGLVKRAVFMSSTKKYKESLIFTIMPS